MFTRRHLRRSRLSPPMRLRLHGLDTHHRPSLALQFKLTVLLTRGRIPLLRRPRVGVVPILGQPHVVNVSRRVVVFRAGRLVRLGLRLVQLLARQRSIESAEPLLFFGIEVGLIEQHRFEGIQKSVGGELLAVLCQRLRHVSGACDRNRQRRLRRSGLRPLRRRKEEVCLLQRPSRSVAGVGRLGCRLLRRRCLRLRRCRPRSNVLSEAAGRRRGDRRRRSWERNAWE